MNPPPFLSHGARGTTGSWTDGQLDTWTPFPHTLRDGKPGILSDPRGFSHSGSPHSPTPRAPSLPGIPSPTSPRESNPARGAGLQLGRARGWPVLTRSLFFPAVKPLKCCVNTEGLFMFHQPGKFPLTPGSFLPHTVIFFPGNFFFFFSKWDFFFFFTQRQQRRDGAAGIWGLDLLIWGVLEGFGHPVPTPSPLPVPINGKEQSKDLG